MKTIMIFLIVLTSSMFAQTSRFTKFFQDTTGSPVTGSTIVLIPEGSVFPNDSLTMIEFSNRPGMYYRVGVPDGNYSLYIDAQFYISDIYIGEVRLTDDLDDYITKRDGLEFILEDDGRYAANKTQSNIIAQWTFNSGNYGIIFNTDNILQLPFYANPNLIGSFRLAYSTLGMYFGTDRIPDSTKTQEMIDANLLRSIDTKNSPLDTLFLSNVSILEQLTMTGNATIFIDADSVNIKTLQVFTPSTDAILTLTSNATNIVAPTGNQLGSTGVTINMENSWYTFTIQYKSGSHVGVTWVRVGEF